MEYFLHFWCLEVLPVRILREVKTFIIWFYAPWLYYEVCLHKVVELVVVIPTSPRSSKMEAGCSSYCRFHFGVSASFRRGGFSRPMAENSQTGALDYLSISVWIFVRL
jgi:hypothetical protein